MNPVLVVSEGTCPKHEKHTQNRKAKNQDTDLGLYKGMWCSTLVALLMRCDGVATNSEYYNDHDSILFFTTVLNRPNIIS